jgi:WD40 repeat protein
MSYCLNPACQKPTNPDSARFCQNCGTRLRLGDRYYAVHPVGSGQLSRTFVAIDASKLVDARCVIKQFANRDEAAFRQEVAQLDELAQHPQIPDLYDYFERNHRQYLVQEWIAGQNLLQQMEELGTFDEPQICQLLQDILPLLKFLHDRQIIHRDIKPTNLIRRLQDDRLMLVDLGAAKQITTTAAKTGTVVGSAEYTAPEQLMGKAEFASDLYSLGVTCIHLLTGLSPFDLLNQLDGTWLWRCVAGKVSDRLAQILDRLLQRSVSDRYPSVQAVLNDLAELVQINPATLVQGADGLSPLTSARGWRNWSCCETLTADAEVNAIALTPDGTTLISAGSGSITQWNLQTGVRSSLPGHEQIITSLALSPDGTLLASGSWDHTIKLWQLETGKLLHTLKGHTDAITAVAISPDGQTLISGSRDRTIRLWDLNASGRLSATLTANLNPVSALSVPTSHDPLSKLFASGSMDGAIQLWHLSTKELLRSLPAHTAAVNAVTIAPDGQTLISSSWDMTVKLRNLHTGRLYQTISGHALPVTAIAISPDSQVLATGSHDNTIKLWNCRNGKLLTTLTEHSAAISGLIFNAITDCLISSSRDGMIVIRSS